MIKSISIIFKGVHGFRAPIKFNTSSNLINIIGYIPITTPVIYINFLKRIKNFLSLKNEDKFKPLFPHFFADY